MPLMNNFDVPGALFEAIKNDPYFHTGDISVTQLINPPQMRMLGKRHGENIEIDVTERFWAACGKAMHLLLSQNNPDLLNIVEKRMDYEIEGWKVSGQIDLWEQETNTLMDYKFVGTYSYLIGREQGKPEWDAQQNIYRYLLHKTHGILVEKLQIVCLLRDWMSSKRGNIGYPPIPIQRLDIPVWGMDVTEQFIRQRVKAHQAAEKMADNELPTCSDSDRWYNAKKAVFLRCAEYCPVRSVCHQARH